MYYNIRPKNAPKGVTIVCFHPIIFLILLDDPSPPNLEI